MLNPDSSLQFRSSLNLYQLVRQNGLALFSGMRPGEILALQWKHVADDHVAVVQRVYRGKLDRPKSERSQRQVAISSSTRVLMEQWRQQRVSADADAWVFPSARTITPLGRDNTWRRLIASRLKAIGLEWPRFRSCDAPMPVSAGRPALIRNWCFRRVALWMKRVLQNRTTFLEMCSSTWRILNTGAYGHSGIASCHVVTRSFEKKPLPGFFQRRMDHGEKECMRDFYPYI